MPRTLGLIICKTCHARRVCLGQCIYALRPVQVADEPEPAHVSRVKKDKQALTDLSEADNQPSQEEFSS